MPNESAKYCESVDRDRSKDTGMAMVLICLLVAHFGQQHKLLPLAIFLLIIDMVWPKLFFYPSKAWFGLAGLMGAVMSRVILTVLFYVVVTPVGVLRRICGADSMQKKRWKDGKMSVFEVRDHTYQSQDIEQPY